MKPIKRQCVDRPSDYLKFWRIIRYYYLARYKMTQQDLEMLLFLYSEQHFDKDKFYEFNNLLGWDKGRFNRLLRDGWVEVFRKHYGKRRTLYEISFKGKRMITEMYKKLDGQEIPVCVSKNPLFRVKVPYSHKIYRAMILKMNEFIKQQRHQLHE